MLKLFDQVLKSLKQTARKIKDWYSAALYESKLKKMRIGLTILSVPIILWKTGPEAFLNNFGFLLRDRSKHFFASLAVAGVLANTPLDATIYGLWIRNFKNKAWMNKIVKWVKKGGEYADLYLPFSMLLLFISKPPLEREQKPNAYQENQWLYDWAAQTIWHFMEGAALQGLGACVLGSARPTGGVRPVGDVSSYWFPFRSRYGVSGHAYHGAFPWMVLAEAVPIKAVKPILYTFSLLPGLSRLQTENHYPSQIFLGWSFAYASATHASIEDIPISVEPVKALYK